MPFVTEGLIVGVGLILTGSALYAYDKMSIMLIAAGAFTLYFFRDPERTVPSGEDAIVSPADGTIDRVQNLIEPSFVGSKGKMISIVLSPFDVHVNRMPVDGTVKKIERESGSKLPAKWDKAFDHNERNHIMIQGGIPVVVTQITGIFARRIVCWVREGDRLKRGQRLGMIRFGSRTNIVLPENVKVSVRRGDRVRGGETIIARIIKS
ncbi:MAG: phosphatidylserine decarboxylase [Candidatus Altiarchaeota archaeon]